jgi:heat induced stress protein YflT
MPSVPRPSQLPHSPRGARRTIATHSSYREAERAVDWFSDQLFPVERIAIVGIGLRSVEQVVGRVTTGRAALVGAGQGPSSVPSSHCCSACVLRSGSPRPVATRSSPAPSCGRSRTRRSTGDATSRPSPGHMPRATSCKPTRTWPTRRCGCSTGSRPYGPDTTARALLGTTCPRRGGDPRRVKFRGIGPSGETALTFPFGAPGRLPTSTGSCPRRHALPRDDARAGYGARRRRKRTADHRRRPVCRRLAHREVRRRETEEPGRESSDDRC